MVTQEIDQEEEVSEERESGEREWREAVEVRIGLLGNRHLRRIIRAFFADKDRADLFFFYPASRKEYNYVHGLATHSVQVARIVSASAATLGGLERAGPVDRDLVTVAALLHRAGVLEAAMFDGEELEVTGKGELFTVEQLSADLVVRLAREAANIPEELVNVLRSLVLYYRDGATTEAVVLKNAVGMSFGVADAECKSGRENFLDWQMRDG